MTVRRDLAFDDGATGLVLTSASRNGRSPKDFASEGGRAWSAAVADGTIVPLELVQDDALVVRVVAGGPLSDRESAEWVDRLTWRLAIPDGRLVVGCGTELLRGHEDEALVRTVDVPPGSYRVDVYTFAHGVNGPACLAKAGMRASKLAKRRDAGRAARDEALERYEREKTRSFHVWPPDVTTLPGGTDAPRLVDFLVHLIPADPGTADLPMPKAKRGWFPPITAPRVPERTPLGVEADGAARARSAIVVTGIDIGPRVAGHALAPIANGPVELAIADLGFLYLLAFACRFGVVPKLRVTGAPGFEPRWPDPRTGLHPRSTEGGFCVDFELHADDESNVRRVHRTTSLVGALPDSAVVELSTCECIDLDRPPALDGLHRYRGTVHDGLVRITDAFPAADAETLRAAVALFREVDLDRSLTFRSEQELAATLEPARRFAFELELDPPLREGRVVRFQDVRTAFALAKFLLRERFPAAWPYRDIDS